MMNGDYTCSNSAGGMQTVVEEPGCPLWKQGASAICEHWKIGGEDAPLALLDFPTRPSTGAPLILAQGVFERLLRRPAAALDGQVSLRELTAATPDVQYLSAQQLARLCAGLPASSDCDGRELKRLCEYLGRFLCQKFADDMLTAADIPRMPAATCLEFGRHLLTILGHCHVSGGDDMKTTVWKLELPNAGTINKTLYFQVAELRMRVSTNTAAVHVMEPREDSCGRPTWRLYQLRVPFDAVSAAACEDSSEAALSSAGGDQPTHREQAATTPDKTATTTAFRLHSPGVLHQLQRARRQVRSMSTPMRGVQRVRARSGSQVRGGGTEMPDHQLADYLEDWAEDDPEMEVLTESLVAQQRRNRELCEELRLARDAASDCKDLRQLACMPVQSTRENAVARPADAESAVSPEQLLETCRVLASTALNRVSQQDSTTQQSAGADLMSLAAAKGHQDAVEHLRRQALCPGFATLLQKTLNSGHAGDVNNEAACGTSADLEDTRIALISKVRRLLNPRDDLLRSTTAQRLLKVCTAETETSRTYGWLIPLIEQLREEIEAPNSRCAALIPGAAGRMRDAVQGKPIATQSAGDWHSSEICPDKDSRCSGEQEDQIASAVARGRLRARRSFLAELQSKNLDLYTSWLRSVHTGSCAGLA
eukprot:TRINITY_DN75535_c0_g1_i1.p1 TRINITY_DN75535_c0_g1~~TRINITY_DN75535_c0_g1_i1.p1  ORF type:complete len:652 (-),score=112.78 TRINITY_DN75535_c0_g1_i1:114-2069(-)